MRTDFFHIHTDLKKAKWADFAHIHTGLDIAQDTTYYLISGQSLHSVMSYCAKDQKQKSSRPQRACPLSDFAHIDTGLDVAQETTYY